jgi:hypothetical protein
MNQIKRDNLIAKIINMPFTTNERYIDVLLKIKKLYGSDYSSLNIAFNFGRCIGKLEKK